METVLLAAPLIVFALVLLLGFVGCGLDTRGIPSGDPPTGETGPGNGDTPPAPKLYAEEVGKSVPIAYWRLSDPDGGPLDPQGNPLAKDEMGAPPPEGDHPGSYHGTVTLGVQPGLNDSDPGATPARFDAAGHVEIAQDLAFQTPAFTVEALVHPDKIDAKGVVVSNMPSAVVSNVPVGWTLAVTPPPDPSNDGLFVGSVGDGPVSVSVAAKFDLAGLGTAWHVAMTFDGMTLTLYKDGAEVDNHAVQAFVPNTQDPLQIGNGFKGAIQEVAVYDRALDVGEILAHYMANVSP